MHVSLHPLDLGSGWQEKSSALLLHSYFAAQAPASQTYHVEPAPPSVLLKKEPFWHEPVGAPCPDDHTGYTPVPSSTATDPYWVPVPICILLPLNVILPLAATTNALSVWAWLSNTWNTSAVGLATFGLIFTAVTSCPEAGCAVTVFRPVADQLGKGSCANVADPIRFEKAG